MKSFKHFLLEDRGHENGTYVSANLCSDHKTELHKWVVNHGISSPLDKEEYHVTIIYSRKPCPQVAKFPFLLPIDAQIIGWEIFDAGIGRCLVAKLSSPQLTVINSQMKLAYGATSDFPDYIPHVTVSYNYEGDAPEIYPNMFLKFDQIVVKGIDPTWKPKK